jgi:hypothetical protein
MANPTTYFGWVMPTSSSLVTNLPADFNTFGQGVDTSLQDLLGGTTGQVLSKTSATNMDFTWVTPTDQTPLTTKGDLFTFTTVDARLAVGANGTSLVADSSAATGLAYASRATLAGNTFTADQNINGLVVGRSAGNVSSNAALGASALIANTTGAYNSAVGSSALAGNTTGSYNIAIGVNALTAATTVNANVAMGYDALGSVTTGANNTAIGHSAGNAGTNLTTGSNNILLGFQAQPTTATVSNQITLGNSANSVLRCQVTSITALSDERDKKNIQPLETGLDFINQLKPVIFDWNMRQPENPELDEKGNPIIVGKVDIPDAGFIAQDFMAAEDAIGLADHLQLSYRDNPESLEITQGRLIPILVKAIQDLTAKVEALEAAQA